MLAAGEALFATDVQVDDLAERLGVPVGDRLQVAPLDLRDPVSIETACQQALAWRPIDVLVNNGGYAVFGRLTSGLEVVDSIAAVPTGFLGGLSDVPLQIVYALQGKVR